MQDGGIRGDYTQAELDRISDGERKAMGLRAASLGALTGNGSIGSRQTAVLRDFRFAYKNAPETLHIGDADIPYGGIIGIIGHNGAGKSTFSRASAGWRSAAAP